MKNENLSEVIVHIDFSNYHFIPALCTIVQMNAITKHVKFPKKWSEKKMGCSVTSVLLCQCGNVIIKRTLRGKNPEFCDNCRDQRKAEQIKAFRMKNPTYSHDYYLRQRELIKN